MHSEGHKYPSMSLFRVRVQRVYRTRTRSRVRVRRQQGGNEFTRIVTTEGGQPKSDFVIKKFADGASRGVRTRMMDRWKALRSLFLVPSRWPSSSKIRINTEGNKKSNPFFLRHEKKHYFTVLRLLHHHRSRSRPPPRHSRRSHRPPSQGPSTSSPGCSRAP